MFSQHWQARLHRFLHRYLRMYLVHAIPSNSSYKKVYNQGNPVTFEDANMLARARDAGTYEFYVPVELCVWGYGWHYTRDENPLTLYYDNPELLKRFYEGYQPGCFEDALALSPASRPESVSTSYIAAVTPEIAACPWGGNVGLGKEHGCNLSGPISLTNLYLEYYRLGTRCVPFVAMAGIRTILMAIYAAFLSSMRANTCSRYAMVATVRRLFPIWAMRICR